MSARVRVRLNRIGLLGIHMAARNTFLIDTKGSIRKVYTKVDPNPHSQQVLADLARLEK